MGQVIGIDSSVFMYVWNDHPDFFGAAAKVLKQIQNNEVSGVFAQIGMIELLTGPKKAGRQDLAFKYRNLIYNHPNLSVQGMDDGVIDLASSLRAKYNIKTPDAIHIATAINAGASKFVTNDKALIKVKEIEIKLLNP